MTGDDRPGRDDRGRGASPPGPRRAQRERVPGGGRVDRGASGPGPAAPGGGGDAAGARGADAGAPSHDASDRAFADALAAEAALAARRARGRASYHAGASAEDAVARRYEREGLRVIATRWRGQAGEIDLILGRGDEGDDGGVVLVEVKQAPTHAIAAEALGARQTARLLAAAAEFLGTRPRGQLTPARFDLALVDGQGRVTVIENALGP